MAIPKIAIRNFTVFENIEIDFCEGINVFIGENGTGKTHLLKLLYAHCVHGTESTFAIPFLSNLDEVFGKENIRNISIMPLPIDYKNCITRPSVFIPAKEVLSMSDLVRIYDKYSNDLHLDKTLINIIKKALEIKPNKVPVLAEKLIANIERTIGGKVVVKSRDSSFWIVKQNEAEVPFNMEAEGYRKLGLLWQLIMNESITQDTVLLWDEPEANINPKLIPMIVNILLELSRQGVQVFLATHDYMFAKYFEVKQEETDKIRFHSLYKTDKGIACESNCNFRDLKNNPIIDAFDELMDEVLGKNLGD